MIYIDPNVSMLRQKVITLGTSPTSGIHQLTSYSIGAGGLKDRPRETGMQSDDPHRDERNFESASPTRKDRDEIRQS